MLSGGDCLLPAESQTNKNKDRRKEIQVHRLNYRLVRKAPTHHDPRVVPVKAECYHHYLSFPEMHLSAQMKMKTRGKIENKR